MIYLATTDSSVATEKNQNLLAAVAYLGVFVTGIILLLLEKKNSFVRFHAMQSTIFFGGLAVISFALNYVPFFGSMLNFFAGLASFVALIVLAWRAFNGELYKLPYIGELAEKQLAKLG